MHVVTGNKVAVAQLQVQFPIVLCHQEASEVKPYLRKQMYYATSTKIVLYSTLLKAVFIYTIILNKCVSGLSVVMLFFWLIRI